MTREEAIAKLVALQKENDIEMEHVEADSVLCQLLVTLGYGDVVTEFNRITKWYA